MPFLADATYGRAPGGSDDMNRSTLIEKRNTKERRIEFHGEDASGDKFGRCAETTRRDKKEFARQTPERP